MHAHRAIASAAALTIAAGLTCGPGAAGAEAEPPAPTVRELMVRDLIGADGKELRMMTVEYPPGGSSLPHRHHAQVFVYVLDGSVRMQVQGGDPVTLGPGETFYEGPDDVHTVSANASATRPAHLLVFMAKERGAKTGAGTAPQDPGQQRAESAGRSLIGTPAPPLVFKTLDGDTIDLGRLYGKRAVYLKFWATWCVPCRQQMPHFEHTYETAGADLAVIAVNSGFNDSVDDVREYRRKLGLTMPMVVDDGRAARAFHLRVTPQHIVIGRDGRILYVGHLADERLEAALVEARRESGPRASTAPSDPLRAASPDIHRYQVGDLLPSESPVTIDGTPFRLGGAAGASGTVLVFLSPWCESYLAASRPAVSADCRRMREQADAAAQGGKARWLGIASGLWATPDDLRDYRTKYRVRIPLVLDESGDLFRAFNVSQVPAALIADGSGRIVRRIDARDLGQNAFTVGAP